jgi:hypothetical protein
VDKEVQVVEKPAQVLVLDQNPKMRVKKIKCKYYKSYNHTITYYSYKHELFSGIALKKF